MLNKLVPEVELAYAYPKDYKVQAMTRQASILRRLFPELKDAKYDERISTNPLPNNAEGWFAIPRWQKLGSTYGEAVEKVLAMIGRSRKFYNWREGQLNALHLRQTIRSIKASQKLVGEQEGYDILTVSAQFGLLHRGHSVRIARMAFATNEFGLGTFVVGIMLLTHPRRLVEDDDLWIDCAGDKFASGADGLFVDVPCFRFRDGRLKFGTPWSVRTRSHEGSASAFLKGRLNAK